jgi:hypothetical protein
VSISFDVEAGGKVGVGGGSCALTVGCEGEGEEVCGGFVRTELEGEGEGTEVEGEPCELISSDVEAGGGRQE